MRQLILLYLLCLPGLALAASGPGTIIRDTVMRAGPSPSSQSLEKLAGDSAVTILERDGGWYRIRSIAGNEGWVRMLSVRFKSKTRGGVAGELRTLSSFASGGGSVATGVRGLSQDQDHGGEGGSASLQPVHDLRVEPDEARAFAGAANLKSRELDYLGGEE